METAVIVEDDRLAANALADLMNADGFVAKVFHCTDDAYQYCVDSPPDVLVLDWCVPGEISTSELVRAIQHVSPPTRCVCVSGYEADALRELLSDDISVEFMSKPIHYDRFLSDLRTMKKPLAEDRLNQW